jgi:hypothetical protein
MAKRKRTNANMQNITHKTKDRVTRTPLKTGGYFTLRCQFKQFGNLIYESPTTKNWSNLASYEKDKL